MNYLKMLRLAALVVAALSLLTGSASATSLTSPSGTTYTGTVKAEAEGAFLMHGPFTTVSCQVGIAEAKLENHGAGVTAGGKLTSLTIEQCNFPVTVLKPGSVEVHSGGTLTTTGAEVTVQTSLGIACIFTTSNTDIGAGTGTKSTGGHAQIDIGYAEIPRTGHSVFCGSSGILTASLTITTPSTLFLD